VSSSDLSRLVRLLALQLVLACASQERAPLIVQQPRTPTDRFWALVESAREGGDRCGRVVGRLTDTLVTLPPTAIEEFSRELSTRMAESYRWDLWAVAYVANGGASDDGFDYFRGWLVTRGRAQFERALRDPPAAVAGARRVNPLLSFECEEMLSVGDQAYEKVAHAPLPQTTRVPWPKSPLGSPWTEETIDQIYPGLTARVRRR
jgi:hypothetical protein